MSVNLCVMQLLLAKQKAADWCSSQAEGFQKEVRILKAQAWPAMLPDCVGSQKHTESHCARHCRENLPTALPAQLCPGPQDLLTFRGPCCSLFWLLAALCFGVGLGQLPRDS